MEAETPTVRIRRIYAEPDGGFRVLVDRLWPRGVSKERAQLDDWLKDVAPSTGLRRWFGHRPERWQGFSERYLQELSENPAAGSFAAECRSRPDTVLLFAARNEQQNEAAVLRDYVLGRLGE
ncbi:DUF488 family protein [Arthrobacter sp. Helios]|uniref:DUF488 domain-containing protein n=1 Tax=Arthrobacter sp. Helios TaxID=2828862 RepID=UPI00204A82D2|nr:DUF488 family protein [Arthrobacter sp. Helios]UPO78541.1 DUF488 family protein [Arthrobacter sp. Helios]